MKKYQILFCALLAGAFAFTACAQKESTEKTGNTATEDMVEGTDGGLDSLNAKQDTASTITSDTLTFQ